MGRGGREQDQAIRLKSIPRRLSRPKELGQRRYRLAHRRRDRSLGGEPGYIRGVYESSKSSYDERAIVVVEDVAVADQNGKLHWLEADRISAQSYNTWSSVGQARQFCDKLNKAPLGSHLVSEVDDKGDLTIKKIRRKYNTSHRFDAAIVEEVEKHQTFDVEQPDQARQAKEFHDQLKEEIGEERADAAATLLDKLRKEGKAEDLFPSQEVADRSRAAQEFSQALDRDGAEQILEKQDKAAEEREAKLSRRAEDTIKSLSQT